MPKDRDALLAEIGYRMKGSEEMTRMLYAMEIDKQGDLALRNWLHFLRRSRIEGMT